MQRHLQVLGLSQRAQTLALFTSYSCQSGVIALSITATCIVTGLFPKTLATMSGRLLLFSFTLAQGVSSFGFVLLITSLLPHKTYPKFAAKWSTLLFFGSTFADFTI